MTTDDHKMAHAKFTLTDNGIPYTVAASGISLKLNGSTSVVYYWPATDTWGVAKTYQTGFGLNTLISHIKEKTL